MQKTKNSRISKRIIKNIGIKENTNVTEDTVAGTTEEVVEEATESQPQPQPQPTLTCPLASHTPCKESCAWRITGEGIDVCTVRDIQLSLYFAATAMAQSQNQNIDCAPDVGVPDVGEMQ